MAVIYGMLFTSAILQVVLTATRPYSISQLEPNGAFFEAMGNAAFYTREWEVYTRVAFVDIKSMEEYVSAGERSLRRLCDQWPKNETSLHCGGNIQRIEELARNIRRTQRMLNPTGKRTRRSFFDGVGSLSKTLFGTMDQADADNIYAKLGELEGDNAKNFELIKENAVVVASNYDKMTQTVRQIEEKHDREIENLELAVVNQNETIRKMLETERQIQLQMTLDEMLGRITFRLQEMERQQVLTASIIMAVQAGKLHPLILSYEQVSSILNASSDYHQVEEVFTSPWVLRQLADVQGMQAADQLVVKISIPLPTHTEYTLNRVYHLPIPMGNATYRVYNFGEGYLAANLAETRYITLTEQEFNHCKKLSLDLKAYTYVCHLTLVHMSPAGSCVSALYNHTQPLGEICHTTDVYLPHDLVIHLTGRNSWLFSLTQGRNVHIECPRFMANLQLHGAGVLGMEPLCEAQIEQHLLIATAKGTSQASPITVKPPEPDWNVPPHPYADKVASNTSLRLIPHASFARELGEGREKMAEFQGKIKLAEKEREARKLRNLQTTHYISLGSIALLLGCIIALTALVVRAIRRKRTPAIVPQVISRPILPPRPPPIPEYISPKPQRGNRSLPRVTSDHGISKPNFTHLCTSEYPTQLSSLSIRLD